MRRVVASSSHSVTITTSSNLVFCLSQYNSLSLSQDTGDKSISTVSINSTDTGAAVDTF